MRTIFFTGTMLVCCWAGAYGQGTDSLTGLPVIPAAETIVAGKSYGFQPAEMPEAAVCKSKMKGAFYALQNMNVKDNSVKISTVVAWYAAHLRGFKKTQGYEHGRSQTAFYNAAGTIVVFITGASGRQGEDTTTYGLGYQHYEPGVSEKTIASLTQGKVICQ
jgi:hypothetical protein